MDLDRFFAELADWSDQHDESVETHRYGPLPDHEADLRLPPGATPRGLVVVIHGGFWRSRFGRETTRALCADLALRGWASWNVEYRRVGTGGGVPATLDDITAALRHLDELEPVGDVPVVLLGHSAGGQLALWAAGTRPVAAVVPLGGVCDLAEAARLRIGDGAALDFVGGTPEQRPELYDLADPMRRLPSGTPALVVHGTDDDRVPPELSRRYAEAAHKAGDPCQLLELEDVGHFEVIDPRTATWSTIVQGFEAVVETG
ncbi:prolyl oligopeptidase family protein [Nonomuraea polychroma]|uniref:Prolyl oligopeptidase family protein n=1 Tax=Nonomuraea polychroma TaxID=46176 RepID=A0A438MAM4_9ACTN|nr:alpha/beta fold hydrolase [Nonomuraea polychroma]RVX42780.1 prolyl oligopeptidase family protein [Nonomuraea polychroma]